MVVQGSPLFPLRNASLLVWRYQLQLLLIKHTYSGTLETLAERNNPMEQAVALFGLYTFHSTQPSTSAPPTQYFAPRISIPIGRSCVR